GHFLEPAVLDHVRHGSAATREEVFGPVAAIVRVRDVAEAIALANDSDYGLGANIYTNNLRYVMQAMEEVKAGTFWVNDPLADTEAAIQAAREAFDDGPWPAATAARRGRVLLEIARRLRESADRLARLETENMGKPIIESEFDVADAATCFEYYGGLATKVT